MLTKLFNYSLPQKLIAQQPVHPRDHSRLLVLDKNTKKIKHKHFYDLDQFLQAGDVLVLNNTKVFPARLIGKKPTGGKMEILLLQPDKNNCWQVLIGGRGAQTELIIKLTKNFSAQLIKKLPNNIWIVKFNQIGKKFDEIINKIGTTPTPPYIKKLTKQTSKEYQTIFAKYRGSVAAPTAGLHFTKKLINQLKKQGVQFEFITLHVGYGTFKPVDTKTVETHQIHSEYAELTKSTAQRLNQAKQEGRRVIAVGTTTVRVLESFVNKDTGYLQLNCPEHSRRATCYLNTFIYPGYQFKFIDAIITNFHLPQSTLLMLVSAFADRKLILQTYQKAIQKKYRFYSFGDVMLIV